MMERDAVSKFERSVEITDAAPRNKAALATEMELVKRKTENMVLFLERASMQRRAAIRPYKSMLLWMLTAVLTAFVAGFWGGFTKEESRSTAESIYHGLRFGCLMPIAVIINPIGAAIFIVRLYRFVKEASEVDIIK